MSALGLKQSLEVRYEDNHENYCASTLTCVGDDVTVKGFVQFAAALDKQFLFDLAVEALTKVRPLERTPVEYFAQHICKQSQTKRC